VTTKVVVGLGNVGAEYARTRHNAGFILLDDYVSRKGLTWQEKSKFRAYITEFTEGDTKIILMKPTTLMNRSGEAVRLLKDFYKVENEHILVIHDELALPFGTIRTRVGGSDAGNNGIKSLSHHIGADFARVRVGILDDELAVMGATDFVLDRFDPEEYQQLTGNLQPVVAGFVADFINDSFAHTTHSHES